MASRALDELRALARRDEELYAVMLDLQDHDTVIAYIRARCDVIDRFFATYTDTEQHLRVELEKAEFDLAERRAELAEAERVVESASPEEEAKGTEMALGRCKDRVRVAETRLTRAHSEHRTLEACAAQLPGEVTRLGIKARALSARADVPAPGSGPEALAEWTSDAHTALFLAISQLATERERITREANEFATMLLGQAMYGSTAAQALRQVEAEAELTARPDP